MTTIDRLYDDDLLGIFEELIRADYEPGVLVAWTYDELWDEIVRRMATRV